VRKEAPRCAQGDGSLASSAKAHVATSRKPLHPASAPYRSPVQALLTGTGASEVFRQGGMGQLLIANDRKILVIKRR
jgi:hypothetical protein